MNNTFDSDEEIGIFNSLLGEYGEAVLNQKNIKIKSDAVTEYFIKCKNKKTTTVEKS